MTPEELEYIAAFDDFRHIFGDVMAIDGIKNTLPGLNARVADCGATIDALDMVEFAMQLEDHFGVEVDEGDFNATVYGFRKAPGPDDVPLEELTVGSLFSLFVRGY